MTMAMINNATIKVLMKGYLTITVAIKGLTTMIVSHRDLFPSATSQ